MRARSVYRDPQWQVIRRAVLQRDGGQCQIKRPGCKTVARCVDHIVPLSEGGAAFDPTNCRAACVPCNSRVNNERRAQLAQTAIDHGLHRRPLNTSRDW